MQTIEQMLAQWLWTAGRAVMPELAATEVCVKAASDEQFGDYQCDSIMALARRLRQPPRPLAEKVLSALPPRPEVAKIELAGPGFINIRLDDAWLAGHLAELETDGRLGIPTVGSGRTVVLDYSSPNVAKPMHIGHIRSSVIGNALDRLHRALGYRVIADNHLGDWGTQFGILILGYRNFLDPARLAEAPVEELERIYVLSYERTKQDEGWLRLAREELVKLQRGDAENRALWKAFVDLSLKEFDRIYRRLGIRFDVVRGESFYNDALPGVLAELREKGLARESEGAQVVFLEEEKLPVCIVQKSDGGFNYATTDLATIRSRLDEFQPDAIIYVTDERQQLHFKQLFAVAQRLGWAANLVHVWFGLMRLPEGTFSTRQGNVIKLEKLLDEAEFRALELVKSASPEMPAEQQRAVARAAGIGAVKYADLSQNPQSLVTFSWEKALSLEGNSAPYLQYAYARMASVNDKYAEQFPGEDLRRHPFVFGEAVERRLALRLARFGDAVARAAAGYRPNILADYLFETAQVYSAFYQNVPFLKAAAGVRESRIRLGALTARVLRSGLELLGIETPERI